MEPVTLHFNVFQAGAPVRTTLQVEDARRTTILDLKKQLFSDALKESKSVRFIAGGKILDDATALERYKLGKEAHIHVSISETGSPSKPSISSADDSTSAATGEAKTTDDAGSASVAGVSAMGWAFIAGALVFIVTGALLYAGLRKRWQYTMHTSQLLFICTAIWVYLLLFHGLPTLFQALSKLGSSTATKDNLSPRGVAPSSIAAPGVGDEATASSSTSPLSLMTPTLPPGDTASVLTQRR